jgi:hypothetical protein
MSTPSGTFPYPPFSGGGLPLTSPITAPTVQVNPELVKAEGTALQHVGEAIPGEATRLFSPSDTAVGQLAGWLCSAALDGCTEAWVTLLKTCATALDQNGGKLLATAANYRDTDTAAAQDFRSLGQGRARVAF